LRGLKSFFSAAADGLAFPFGQSRRDNVQQFLFRRSGIKKTSLHKGEFFCPLSF
jgi:hypothetical protein